MHSANTLRSTFVLPLLASIRAPQPFVDIAAMFHMTNRHAHLRLIRRFSTLVCGSAVALLLTLVAPSWAKAAGTCPVTAMTSASQPACWTPFVPTSPFNTPLPPNPTLASDNAAVLAHMATYNWSIDGSNSDFDLSPTHNGTRPVFFATPSDPVMTISCAGEYGAGSCAGANKVSINGAKINVPAGAEPYANSDAHMTVVETATGSEYDLYNTSVSGSTIQTGAGAMVNVNTGDGRGSLGDAAQLGLTAGLLRPAELASGQIDHALAVTVPCVNASGPTGFTWPAEQGSGSPCGSGWDESTI
jgi:hypothetical protein